jgi:secreted trypsin-like serine protease
MRKVAKQAFLTSILAGSLTSGIAQAENQSRIVNGNPTGQGFDWMTRLKVTFKEGTFGCGATLIHEKWLLTAAHCVEENGVAARPENIRMGIGVYDEDDTDRSDVEAEQVIIHRGYRSGTVGNDIALIKLKYPSTNQPVRIVTQQEFEVLEMNAEQSSSDFGSLPLTAMGWGRLDSDQDGPELLHSVEMFKVKNRNCGGSRGNYFCADHPTKSNNVCSGDSGGPILTRSTGWVQIGINSFVTRGVNCSESSWNGFANIAALRSFIEQYIPDLNEQFKPDVSTPNTSVPGNSSTGNTPSVGGTAESKAPAAGSFSLLLALGLLPAIRRRRMI